MLKLGPNTMNKAYLGNAEIKKAYLGSTLVFDNSIDTTSFITTWKTDNAGVSNSTSITIPITGGGYNYDVSWKNDGVWESGNPTTHDYGTAGTYTVAIRGAFPQIRFNNSGDKLKILSIEQWGNNVWRSMERAFYGCANLVGNVIDVPNLSSVTSMYFMFRDASSFDSDLSLWDVSNVVDMYAIFYYASSFDSDLSLWNVSNVVDMYAMFQGASSFDSDLSLWNVSNVTTMTYMFYAVTLSTANYDALLNGWASRPVKPSVSFHGGNSKYSPSGKVGRDILLSKGWTIVDSGQI